ncbi:MAG: hypothetical protein ACTSSK_13390 [Candidatus Heimdallarchaeota archaeon]
MNTKLIILVTVIISLFFLVEISLIIQFLRRKRTNRSNTKKRYLTNSADSKPLVWLMERVVALIGTIILFSLKTWHLIFSRIKKKKHDRQSEEIELASTERSRKEQEEFEARFEQEKIELKEKVEALRAKGYTASKRDKSKIMEIISNTSKTNLSWASGSTRVSKEEIILIIENEPDFEIQKEYIINKKKIQNEDYKSTSS